ncbi:MAG TPA: DNA/RNA helicase domain-containing protein, partial [Gemmatimonadaceae bacterium]|nr:DNA/RNA helicase domain-containing protein [Gemmatimonadaceae bacterium]
AIQSEISQARELVRCARVSVFFLDERQNVRPDEIGTIDAIREAAATENADVREVRLSAQFRCNGCGGYLDWVNELMSDDPIAPGGWRAAGEYDLRTFDTPSAMEAELVRLARAGHSARMVAGFCWPWSDPNSDGSLTSDVQIGVWKRPWNEKPPEQRKPPKPQPRADRHPYTLWATHPERIREIGCIYSAQGLEFDYCGVILGDDLVWRDGGWIADKARSSDSALARRRIGEPELVALLQHTYRVLLTRGIKGTFMYSTDPETRRMLEGLLTGA